MLIVCPACASAYEIDADTFGAEGRSVRCAACRETFFVTPDAAAEDPFAAAEAGDETGAGAADPALGDAGGPAVLDHPMPPPRPARPAAAPRKGRKASGKGGLKGRGMALAPRMTPALAAGLVVLAILPLAALGRGAVVRAVPQSAALFSAVGLPVNLRGVEIRDVAAFRNPPEAGRPARLVVEGDLLGVARERVAVPLLEVELRDGQGRPLRRWTFAPPRTALEPAETARFRASLDAPPAEARGIEVRFADAGTPADPTPDAAAASAVPVGHGGH